jgi:Sec-independent protein secretion pathway component TatC
LLFAAPMLVLYIVSIGVAWLFQKKKPADMDEA